MRSLPVSLAFAAVLTLGLVGCAPDNVPDPSSSPTTSERPSSEPSEDPTPEPSDEPTPEPTDEPMQSSSPTAPPSENQSTPVTISCNDLVNRQAVYDYNPNYGAQPGFTPASGTDAAAIVANQGVACSWVNQTSGITFDVAVAQLASNTLDSIKSDLRSSSTPVSGIGDAAFFSAGGGTGMAAVFSGPYWLVASSVAFEEFANAKPLLQAALLGLGR